MKKESPQPEPRAATHFDRDAIFCLAALGVSGKYRTTINGDGGPARYLFKHFSNDDIVRAQKELPRLEQFVESGGIIVGADCQAELGRIALAPYPPLCAFLRGNRDLLRHRPTLAIVGSRQATPRGLKHAHDLAARFAKKGILIVSGGAMGIDLAAHVGAMQAGPTLAVLGEVLQKNDERPRRLLELHPPHALTTLTTYGPWVPQSGHLFALRNQYVAALADAVVVVEGSSTSGALHTARYARKIGVPVWAIPGHANDPLARAPNQLISAGRATPLRDWDELLEQVLQSTEGSSVGAKVQPDFSFVAMPDADQEPENETEAHPLLKLMNEQEGAATLDGLCAVLGKAIPEVQQALFELMLLGKVHKQGSTYVAVRN